MAGHDDRARPAVEQVLQRGEGVDVEVVGGLVEQEDIRFGRKQSQQLQPPLLAAGEIPDRRPQPCAGEAEHLGELGRGQLPIIQRHPSGDLLDGFQHPQAHRHLTQLLGQEGGLHGLPAPHHPGVREGDPGQQPQQGGLARPVRADDTDPVAGPDVPGDIGQQGPLIGNGDRLQLEHLLAEPGGGQAAKRHLVTCRWHVGDQRVRRVDAEPGLAGARRRSPAQPGDLLAQHVLAFGLDVGGDPGAFGTGERPGRVPALVAADGALADLPRPDGDGIEEPAVVGDDDERAAPLDQVRGEPADPGDVEVVGRLVQDQQVRRADQQRGERDPAALAPRHRLHQRVEAQVGHAEAGQHGAHARVAGPLMLRREAFGQPGGADDHVAHRGGHRQVEGLGQGGDPEVTAVCDPAGVRLDGLGEQPQQRRLARGVEADDADPVVVLQPEGDVFEKLPGRVTLADPVEVDDVGH